MKFPSTTTRSVRNEHVGRPSRLRANLSLPLGSLLTSELVSSSTRGLHPYRLAMHSCRHQREDGEDGEEKERKKEKEKKGGGGGGGGGGRAEGGGGGREEKKEKRKKEKKGLEEEEEEEQSGDSKRFLEIYKRDKKRNRVCLSVVRGEKVTVK